MSKKSSKRIALTADAKNLIPGGNSLLSKRAEMFAPDQWPNYFQSAKGIEVIDIDGNAYKDFSHFGVGTNTLGYGNLEVDNAVRGCIDMGNMCTLNPPEEVYLAKKLISMHPWSSMARFARTGGEANAIAVRIARNYNQKNVIAFCGYHGWHDWYLAANIESSSNLDKQLLSGLSARGVPSALEGSVKPFMHGDLEGLESILESGDVAAVKMEVMRSNEPEPGYLDAIRQLTNKYNCLLIFDECTSGFRESFGGLHLKYGVKPDIAIFGKTLGNGYAISSVIGTKEVMSEAQNTFISSTFFTERIGFVAACKALEEIEKNKSWEHITKLGKLYKKKLDKLFSQSHFKYEIAGMDALASFVIHDEQWLEIKTYLIQEMLKNNYLTTNLFYPSLAHTEKDLADFFKVFGGVFNTLAKHHKNKTPIKSLLDGSVCHSTFQRLN
tara:strand:- start:1253 stop:2572 length:1320 start_codon:yes stop_codon:yes gene_type:complete